MTETWQHFDYSTVAGNRDAKLAHVNNGTVHQVLVYLDSECVGRCQYGPPAEVATIKNPKAYKKDLVELPEWPFLSKRALLRPVRTPTRRGRGASAPFVIGGAMPNENVFALTSMGEPVPAHREWVGGRIAPSSMRAGPLAAVDMR